MNKIDFLFENRLYLSSFSIKFVQIEEYHKIFDAFEKILKSSLNQNTEGNSEHSQKMGILLSKMNDFLSFLIDQKQSKYFYYWYNGRFFIEFILKQRDMGILILALKILFKLLKNRNKNPESIRIFFDDLFEPFFGFLFAINNGPVLGQFQTLNSDFLQDPSMEKGRICFDFFKF